MEKHNLLVCYDGPTLANGEMDVKDLAPALLSLGTLFEEANRVLNKDRAELYVNIRSFQQGSFGIDLAVVQSVKDQFINFFTKNDIVAACNLITLLGFSYNPVKKGLIWLLKKEKGRTPKKVIRMDDYIKLVYDDEEISPVDLKVFELYKDIEIRKVLYKSLDPLQKRGINVFYSRAEKGQRVEIKKQEVKYFQLPEIKDEIINEFEEIKLFTIVSLSFREDNKWRLSDGQNTFYVTIQDKDFLNKINSGEIKFAKGDMLKVRLRTIQMHTSLGLKTEYEAIKVLQHISSPKQLTLPFF